MELQALFLDIDETLISPAVPVPTARTLAAIARLQQAGVPVFLATGRHRCELGQLGLGCLAVCDGLLMLDGAVSYYHGQVIDDHPIDPGDARAMARYAVDHSLPCVVASAERLMLNCIDANLRECYEYIRAPIPGIVDLQAQLDRPLYMFNPFGPQTAMDAMLAVTAHCTRTIWHPHSCDIIARDSGKDVAIRAVASRLGLDMACIMAIGDSLNDLGMLRAVGHPVAMGNGHPDVRQAAEYVTADVVHDGVAQALHHYGLL